VNRVYDKEVGLVVGADHVLRYPVPVVQGNFRPVGLTRLQHSGPHQRLGAPDLADEAAGGDRFHLIVVVTHPEDAVRFDVIRAPIDADGCSSAAEAAA